ncbi:P-loop containing nucleoside triphosphate hydrolase protein [Dioscorea alata]|uniref:P-loop containing nucleoside triphosphate hydrolase protein n=1 Tax=Dioscorea alata TaxID=55571 RepID=A0ACB7V3L7_DIOAL|nr:P-loop containing nucleoside triphosphate hydrolase protein [Dioscorea alata]
MAPAITYNSFHLVSSPRSKPNHANVSRKSIILSAAKQNAFSFGRRQKKSEDESEATEQTKPNNGFFFDFGKIPDPKSLVPIVSSPSTSMFGARRKDPGTVFVAGATGQAGVRIVQSLLRQGFAVRAGVPDLPSAQELARLASTYKIISSAESKRLNAVESAFNSGPESIAKAIGPAAKVVVTVGPTENGPLGEVTTNNALEVILAAQLSKVDHVAVVYDSATGVSSASSGNVIDGITTFFSNLFSGSQSLTLSEFLNKIVETDVSYTLIKTKLTEDFSAESSYGLVVSNEGSSTTEFKVSRSQIAKLVADVFSNTSISENKVVEVSASPSAPSKSITEIFSAIREDGRRKAYAEAVAKANAEEALIAAERARETEAATKKLKEEVKKASAKEFQADSIAKEAQEKAAASLNGILNKAKDFSGDFSWDNLSSKFAAAVPQKSEEEQQKTQIATVRGTARASKLTPKKAVVKQTTPKPKPKPKAEVRKVLGGLFKQETIYIDDE